MKKESISYQIYAALIIVLTAMIFYYYNEYKKSGQTLQINHVETQIKPSDTKTK